MSALTFAIHQLKGGVGKSTLAVNLAAALALGAAEAFPTQAKRDKLAAGLRPWSGRGATGRRVLMVDLDRQMTSSDYFRVRGTNGQTFTAALAGDSVPLEAMTHAAQVPLARGHVDVLPARPGDFERATAALPSYPGEGVNVIRAAIAQFTDDYDFIVLDLRPELTPFTKAAVAASDGVLIPCTSEFATAIHLESVRAFVKTAAQESGASPEIAGIVRTMWESSYEADQVDALLPTLGMPILDARVPRHKLVSKAFTLGLGPCVSAYPKSAATRQFLIAAAETVARTRKAGV